MNLNCQPGDIARIVRPFAEWGVDHFVTVMRLSRPVEQLKECDFVVAAPDEAWVCTGHIEPPHLDYPLTEFVIADGMLRPIRFKPGDDETFMWVDRPIELAVLHPRPQVEHSR